MRHSRQFMVGVAVVLLAGLPVMGAAGLWTAPKATDKVEGGVNWTTQFIQAKAIGVAPSYAVSPEHGRALAITAGTVLARQELLAIAHGVAIDSRTTVQALMVAGTLTEARVSGVIRGAQVVETRDLGGGAVEVTVAVPATGEFADLVLPQMGPPKPPAPIPAPPVAPDPKPQASPAPAPAIYSGLVIDARGLGVKPAMAPKVLSEGGQEIYGSAVVDRDWAVREGMAGYSKDLFAAQSSNRVGEKPLVVKALRAAGANTADVVVSNADAAKLLAAAENLSFLEKARVMIVVD